MFNEQDFVNDFLVAAKENNEDKMKELAEDISTQSVELRIDVLERIVKSLKESGDNDDVQKGLDGTLQLMKLALEAATHEDSAGEVAKETDEQSDAKEATTAVAADASADKAYESEASASTPVAESGGYAPTEEEKEEKSEQ